MPPVRGVLGPGLAAVVAVVALGGCTAGDPAPDRASLAAASPGTHHPARDLRRVATDQVLAVSVDGLDPDALDALGPGGAPTLHRLVSRGASTMDARTVVELTDTLPNHTSMLTGRRVDADEGGHGVAHNEERGGTVHAWAGRRVPSVLSVLGRHDRSAAVFAMKGKFRLFARSWPRPVDRFVLDEDGDELVSAVVADLRERRRALRFVHLAAPDAAGHEHGFMSAEYLEAVAEVDRRLGRLVRTVARTPRLRGTTLVLTADHGGAGGTDHSDADDPDNYTVPFLAWGAGVRPGSDLYALNRDRRHPGDARPGWEGPQPVRNAEVANLVLDLLGLPAVRGADANRRQDLDLR